MPTPHAVCEFKRIKGVSLKADIYHPGTKKPPVLMYIHGGALIGGSRNSLGKHQREAFLDAGFALLDIDYRLAPETNIAGIMEDIRDAIAWVKGDAGVLFNIDAHKLCIGGGSAGGYLSLMTGTFDIKPRAIVAFYGYGDLIGDWLAKPDPFYRKTRPMVSKAEVAPYFNGRERTHGRRGSQLYLYSRQQGRWQEVVTGHKMPVPREVLLPFCPLFNVQADYPPTMLLHGDADTDVPCEQSVLMAKEFKRKRVPHELVIVPKGVHGFDYYPNDPAVAGYLKQATEFMRKYV